MKFLTVSLSLLLACVAFAQASEPTPAALDPVVSYAGGDGRSVATAITISGVDNESDGVSAEYAWLEQNLPGAKLDSQALLIDSGRTYDQLEVETASGEKRSVFFDITSFFGKM